MQGSHRSNKPVVVKSATLGFLCYKSCFSIPRLDSCRGKKIVPVSQTGSWADKRQSPDQSQITGGCIVGLLGKFSFKNVLSYKANLVRGCLIANTSLYYFRERQASVCFGACWGCAQ